MLVEPIYGEPIEVDEYELRSVLRYSRRIPGYHDLRVITSQLALVNKNITSIKTLLESVVLRDGTRIHLKDYLSSIIKETLGRDEDIERIKRRLDLRAGMVLSTSLSWLNFLMELLIALITVASFSQRPWHKPAPRTYTRVLKTYQEFYREKLKQDEREVPEERQGPPPNATQPHVLHKSEGGRGTGIHT